MVFLRFTASRAHVAPLYSYVGYYPASYGYGYAPAQEVVVVRHMVVAPIYYAS